MAVLLSFLGLSLFANPNDALLAQHLKNLERIKKIKIQKLAREAKDIKYTNMHHGSTLHYKKLLHAAKSYLGVKYRYGGNSKEGIDCSAFVQKVYSSLGERLPRTSAEQFKKGVFVQRNALKPGDLVFFSDSTRKIGHVGIFLGNDKFIHASSGAKQVTITSLSKSYYTKHFKGGKRF